MQIVLAPDSFKNSLSANDVCLAMELGIKKVVPTAKIRKIPMADGGEGTVQALVASTGGTLKKAKVTGPLGQPVTATFGILGDGKTAVIEMAEASGLPLVPPDKRNPLKTTTYGTGQLILEALKSGCQKFIIGIGGSATTDCGTGMAQALGIRFYRHDGSEIKDYMCGELMGKVAKIDLADVPSLLKDSVIVAACDVENPLLGEHGVVMVYSRQKGATDEQLQILENNMAHIIGIIEKTIGKQIRHIPGSGAAGGLGAGLIAFANATLKPGIQIVLDACRFSKRIWGASLILTGEGKIDFQTAYGKTISGVLQEASRQSIPVIAIAGSIEEGAENLYQLGLTSMFSICSGPISLQEAMGKTSHLIETTTERIIRLWAGAK